MNTYSYYILSKYILESRVGYTLSPERITETSKQVNSLPRFLSDALLLGNGHYMTK